MQDIVEGWKGMVEALAARGVRIHERTLKKWHYQRLKIPFDKTWPTPGGRIIIERERLLTWYKEVIQALKTPRSDPY